MTYAWVERSFFAFQNCVVPVSKNFSEEQKQESLRLIRSLLKDRPATIHRSLILFFVCLNFLSFSFSAKPFYRLNERKQSALLMRLFHCPISLIRKGFWGINTLARLSVYGQPSVYPVIGYRMRQISHERKSS